MALYSSMIGAIDVVADFYCYVCDETYELEGGTEDDRTIAYANCEVCGTQLELYRDN